MILSKRKKIFIILIFLIIIVSVVFLKLQGLPRPNILLITIDCLRPDHLSCYGYKQNTSPNIDKLAGKGVLFTQAISQGSWTAVSVTSIVTATYPSTHQVYSWDNILSPDLPTIAKILKKQGYYNFLCSGHDNTLFEILSVQSGFDKWSVNKGIIDGHKVNELALDILEKNKNRRFFLWVHYMDAHDKSIGLPEERHLIENITPEEINNYTYKYDRAIGYVDDRIGIILEKLKALGLYKDTLIIITADHGEEISGHGLCFQHRGGLWDSLIRVPLIISYPRLFSKNKNKIITQQIQHIDILPTICDILKIKKSELFEGKSFLRLLRGETIHPSYAFSEYKENKRNLSSGEWIYTKISIRSSEWKLIYTQRPQSEAYELYNLKNDARELNNLVEIEKEQFYFLQVKLEDWLNRPKVNVIFSTKPLDKKTEARLRSLGYLQ